MCQFSEEGNVRTEDPAPTVEEITAEMSVQEVLDGLEGEGSNPPSPTQTGDDEGQDGETSENVVTDDVEHDAIAEKAPTVAPPPGFSQLRADPTDLHLQLEDMTLNEDLTPVEPEPEVYEGEGHYPEEYYPEWNEPAHVYQHPAPLVVPVPEPIPAAGAVPGQVVGTIDDFQGLVAAGMPTPNPEEVQGPLVFWGPDEAGRFIGGPAHLLPGYFTPAATQVQDLPGSYPSPPVSYMSHHQPSPTHVTKATPPVTMTTSPKRVEALCHPEKGFRCSSVDSGHDDTFSETESTGFDAANADPAQPQVTYDVTPEAPQHVVYEQQPYYPGAEVGYQGYAPVQLPDGSIGYYDPGNGYYDNQQMDNQYVAYDYHGYSEAGQAMVYPGYYSDQTVLPAPFTSYQGYPEYAYGHY